MENPDSLSNWVAYIAIGLFLTLLVVLVMRTMFMIGSVVFLNFFKRRGKESDSNTSVRAPADQTGAL